MSVSGDFSSVLLLLFLLLFFLIFIRKSSVAYVIYEVSGESRTEGTREMSDGQSLFRLLLLFI